MKKLLSAVLALTMFVSCAAGVHLQVFATPSDQRLNQNTVYAYSYPGPRAVAGDDRGTLLTDGAENVFASFSVNHETKSVQTWEGHTREMELFPTGKTPHFYIQNDFGFLADVKSVKAVFGTASGAVLPQNAEVFVTNDGYNYDLYPAQTLTKNGGVYEIRFAESVRAKGIKLYVYTPAGTKTAVSELSVYGVPNANARILLSQGAPYTWQGKKMAAYSDANGTKLTDGIVAAPNQTDRMVGMEANREDPVSKSSVSELDMDLKAVKNVSEINFTAFTEDLPQYVTVRYSEDGVRYYDFGQGYPQGEFGMGNNRLCHFSVLRNHTVKARYLHFSIRGNAVLSEIQVYGSAAPMAEMNYGFERKIDPRENTNIAQQGSVKNGWTKTPALIDADYNTAVSIRKNSKKTFIVDLNGSQPNVNGIMVYFEGHVPASIKTYICTEGTQYVQMNAPMTAYTVAGRTVYRQYFDNRTAKKVKIVVQADRSYDARFLELGVYADQPHLPIYRGGFFQVNCLDYNHEHAVIKNSDQMWYMQLKGMKEQGMDQVILAFGAQYTNKRVCFPAPRLLAKGYQLTYGMGSADPYRAILEAAQKLGMKVYIGTIVTYGSKSAIMNAGGMQHIQQLLDDDHDIIQDIYDLYSQYPSFAGYYFANETCDQWLNEADGPALYRTLYGTQSKWIRQIAPEKKIMMAPAVWGVGDPVKNGNLFYDLVKPETAGGRPVADIFAPQDCLGRDPNLGVSDAILLNFEKHIQEWAKGARRAGCDFWMDAEVFEQSCYPKRYEDDIKGLEMQAKYTNSIVNFDIPHYFTEITQGNLDSWKRFDMSYTITQYAKRYATRFAKLDRVGRGCVAVPPYEMMKVNYGQSIDPILDAQLRYTKVAPSMGNAIVKNQWPAFKAWARNKNGNNAAYSMMWDENKLYLAIDTDDQTVNPGSWGAGDTVVFFANPKTGTDIQITNMDAGANPNAARLVFYRQADGSWVFDRADSLGAAAVSDTAAQKALVTVSGTKDADGDAQFMAAIDWSLFGLTGADVKNDMAMTYGMYYSFWDTSYEAAHPSGGDAYCTRERKTLAGYVDELPFTDQAPTMGDAIVKSQWTAFTPWVRNENHNNASYAFQWNKEALYLAIDTDDKTVNPGSWGAGDTIVLFVNPVVGGDIQVTDMDANVNRHAARLVFYRQADGSWAFDRADCLGSFVIADRNTQKTMVRVSGSVDAQGDAQFMAAIDWKLFGINDLTVTNGMKLSYGMYYSFWDTSYEAAKPFGADAYHTRTEKTLIGYVPKVYHIDQAPTMGNVIDKSQWGPFTSWANDKHNNHASYAMRWDSEHLYLAIDTDDKTIEQGSWGKGDTIIAFFNPVVGGKIVLGNGLDREANPHCYRIIFYRQPDGSWIVRNDSTTRGSKTVPITFGADKNVQVYGTQDASGDAQFMAVIDWSLFGLTADQVHSGMKLSHGMYYTFWDTSYATSAPAGADAYRTCDEMFLA